MKQWGKALGIALTENKAALGLLANRIASLSAQLAVLPILAQSLGLRGLGVWAYCQLIIQILGTNIDLGYNVTGISEVVNNNKSKETRRQIFCSIQQNRLIALLLSLLVLVLTVTLSSDEEKVPLSLTSLALIGLYLSPQWYFNGIDKIHIYANTATASRLIALLTIYTLNATERLNPTGTFAVLFAGELLIGVISWLYIKKNLQQGFFNIRFKLDISLLKNSLLAWSNSLGSILLSVGASLTIRHIGGLETLGIYAAAERIYKVSQSFLWPILQAYLPKMSKIEAHPFESRVNFFSKRHSIYILVYSSTLSLIMFFASEQIIKALFGPLFNEAANFLKMFSIAFSVYSINMLILYSRHFARGDNHQALATSILSVSTMLFLSCSALLNTSASIAAYTALISEIVVLLYFLTKGWTYETQK